MKTTILKISTDGQAADVEFCSNDDAGRMLTKVFADVAKRNHIFMSALFSGVVSVCAQEPGLFDILTSEFHKFSPKTIQVTPNPTKS